MSGNPFDKYFGDIGNVNASGNNTYVRPGRYLAEILAVEMKQNRSEEDIFVIEMLVRKVLATVDKTAEGKPNVSNSVGTKMSQVIKFVGAGADMALPNIKGFCEAAIEGFAGASADEQRAAIGFTTGPEEPLKGVVVEVDAAAILTRGNKRDFTQIRYERSLDEAQQAEEGL